MRPATRGSGRAPGALRISGGLVQQLEDAPRRAQRLLQLPVQAGEAAPTAPAMLMPYTRKAISAPAVSRPASTSRPPNHRMPASAPKARKVISGPKADRTRVSAMVAPNARSICSP